MDTSKPVFPLLYLAPINYYAAISEFDEVVVDVHQNFQKQSYHNRCRILGPNGLQILSLPIIKNQNRPLHNKIILDDGLWRKNHWRSLEAAYRRSAYFEFYEDDLKTVFFSDNLNLVAFNYSLLELTLKFLQIETKINQSESYVEASDNDYRNAFDSKNTPPEMWEYFQVFSDRNPFMPNLSIVDLLFAEGPATLQYLKNI